jgi:protein transport protein DSL1/ZW10
MQMINALDYGMTKVADLMRKHVLVPAISNVSVAVNVEILDEGSPKHYVSVLRVVPSEEQKDDKDGSNQYSRIIDISKLTCKFICVENSKWMQSFAK